MLDPIKLTRLSIELKKLLQRAAIDKVSKEEGNLLVISWMQSKVKEDSLTVEQCFHIFHSVMKALEMIIEIYRGDKNENTRVSKSD